MYSIWYDISVITPEVNIIIGALLLLLFGSYSNKKCLNLICLASIAIMLFSIYYISSSIIRETTLLNGMLKINEFTSTVKILILLAAIGIVWIMIALEKKEVYLSFEMPVLIMLSVSGMMFLVSSNNLLSLYLSLELMSLPLYIMAAYDRDNELSTEAGLKYFILGALASGIYLYGASLVYGFTGAGDFVDINAYYLNLAGGEEAESITMPIGFLVGLIFISIAICFKIAAAPFHIWAPDVYQGSPTIVTAFFASAPKIAALALFARILYDAFADLSEQWVQVVLFVSVASMYIGSLGALRQTNIKRLLAYSSIGHVGFALIGLASGAGEGLKGLLVYLIIYLSMTLGVFACILMLTKNGKNKEEIQDFSGLAKAHPYLAFAIAVLLFSLAGIPPLAGFFAKFFVLNAAIKQGMYIYAVIAVIASVIAAFYYLRIVKVMYFDEAEDTTDGFFPFPLKAVAAIAISFNLFYVLLPAPVLIIAEEAVKSFLK
jgi:NADH-quinone oxidoreductase subunit N